MFLRHTHAKQTKKTLVHTHKQWKSIEGVYHSWTHLMSRLLFVTLMLNMLDEVINTVQLSSLIMQNWQKKIDT